jgi:hypothetical protein
MRQFFRLICLSGLLALYYLLAPGDAQAIEVKCIEASKYKYLWKLFDDDPKKFAAYLQLDPAKLPSPEFCRAALLTGGIGFANAETQALLDFIIANQGWLATLYLRSGGGSIGEGVKLALLTRMFWLKTRSSYPVPIDYEPDFLLPPLGGWAPRGEAAKPDTSANAKVVAANWPNFARLTKPLPQPVEFRGRGVAGCVSSCSMIFVGGIDRQGVVNLHRPNHNGAIKDNAVDPNVSLSEAVANLQGSERFQVALYEQMDAGEAFVRTYRTQPNNYTAPATTSRMVPYISDIMLSGCGSDAAQLQDIDTQIRSAIGHVNEAAEGFVDTEHLRLALRTVYERRELVENCVAIQNERERLSRFSKLCGKTCDAKAITKQLIEQYQQVAAKATPPQPSTPPRPSEPPKPATASKR